MKLFLQKEFNSQGDLARVSTHAAKNTDKPSHVVSQSGVRCTPSLGHEQTPRCMVLPV